jgi:serine protease AprX
MSSVTRSRFGNYLIHLAVSTLVVAGELSAQTGKVSADLLQALTNPLGSVNAIVQFNNPATAADLAKVGLLGGVITNQYSLIPAVSLTLPKLAVTVLAALPTVQFVSIDRTVGSLNDYTRAAVNAAAAAQYGVDGSGIGIALIDSGISSHADLMNAAGTASRVVHRESFVTSKLADD